MTEDIRPYAEPFSRFRAVYEEAVAAGMAEPNAMVVSSVDAGGQPSSRVVLLKSFDERGFVFSIRTWRAARGGRFSPVPGSA